VGVPQGSIISPLLSNLILHQLDEFMEMKISSLEQENMGKLSYKANPVYHRLEMKIYRLNKKIAGLAPKGKRLASRALDIQNLKQLITERRRVTSTIPNPDFTGRIRYVRYADD